MVVRAATTSFISPFALEPDPMQFLFLYNFDGDDEHNGFEYQSFDDTIKGRGNLVIMWRKDGKVDFYMTPGIRLNRERADVASGVGEWITTEFDSHYAITPKGLQLEVQLRLKDGRALHVVVKENRNRPRKPMTILAPMGAGIENPVYMPFYWLKDIDLVQVKDTKACLQIGDETFAPSRIPIPIPYSRAFCYFARYCTDPFMVTINPAYTGTLPLLTPDALTGFTHEQISYDFRQGGDALSLERLAYGDGNYEAFMTFEPPFPNVLTLPDDTEMLGHFDIGVDAQAAVIHGDYRVFRDGQQVQVRLMPTENWKPQGSFAERLTLRMFPSEFRTWLRTFVWTACIDLSDSPDGVHMASRWERVNI